jgi:hypothetical protein
MSKPKWTWHKGRLLHPTEAHISLSIDEAYLAQQNNPDIKKACEDAIKPFRVDGIDAWIDRMIRESREENEASEKRRLAV